MSHWMDSAEVQELRKRSDAAWRDARRWFEASHPDPPRCDVRALATGEQCPCAATHEFLDGQGEQGAVLCEGHAHEFIGHFPRWRMALLGRVLSD